MGADDRASVFMLDGKFVTGVVEHAETVPGFGKFDKSRDAAGERVENGRGAVGFREKFICRALHQRVTEIKDFRMLFLGRLVDHSDGGAGNDVMELIEQQKFPCAVEFFRRVVREGEHGAEEFGLREHLFAFPVSPLGPRLRGERSPVKFQIEFALPDGQFGAFFVDDFKEAVRPVEFVMRTAVESGETFSAFDVFRGGAASAVADAVKTHEVGERVALGVAGLRLHQLLRPDCGIVGVFGREVGQNLAVVDALPEERVVREAVELAPGEFLCEKIFASGFPDDLGEGGGVAENIGNPEISDVNPEFIFKEVLAVEELADHGFSADEVAVRFNPHSALNFPASGGDGLFDFFVKSRIVLFDECVMLSRGCPEDILRIFFDECDLGAESACALADAFADGPEPAGVDMSVSDSVRRHHGAGRSNPENLLQDFTRRGGVCGSFVADVRRLADDGEEAADAEIPLRKPFHERDQHFQIEIEIPDFAVEYGEVAVDERSGETFARVIETDFACLFMKESEERIGGSFNPEIQFGSRFDFFERIIVFVVIAGVDGSSGEPVNGSALRVENERFAADVHQQGEFLSQKFFRNGPGDMEPRA